VDTALTEWLRSAGNRVTQISPEALDGGGPDAYRRDIEPGAARNRISAGTGTVVRPRSAPSPDTRARHIASDAARLAGDARRAAVDGQILEEGIAQAPFWGLGRTVHYEHPELNCTLIDLDPASDEDELMHELLANNGENQVAFRGGARYVARVARHEPDSHPAMFKAGDRPFRLEIDSTGVLDRLRPARDNRAACRKPAKSRLKSQPRA
jgi:hypothetical protein